MNETRKNFAENSGVHFALREFRRDFSGWRTYALLAIAILLIGWSGPFGTSDAFALPQRLAYWAAVILLTYCAAHLAALFAGFHLRARKVPRTAGLFVIVPVAGLAATIAVWPVMLFVEGRDALSVAALSSAAWHGLLVAAAVVLAFELVGGGSRKETVSADATADDEAPRILERLPVDKRGRLISLSVSDHYVEVVTARGRFLVLIRLKDAIAEAQGEPGLQIHRSHWVAFSAIDAVERTQGKLTVVTTAGERLPVSRSFAEAVREAGLLPR